MKKKKYRKSEKIKKNFLLNEDKSISKYSDSEENRDSKSGTNFLRLLFTTFILLVFFSSVIIVFFNTREDRDKIIYQELKKGILQRLRKEGPSVEIYRAIAEIYKDKDPKTYYLYLQQALSLVKPAEVIYHRDLIKNLVNSAYQNNEKIDKILEYLILLYRSTKPSNPEYFEILGAIIEIYDATGNYLISEKILKNFEQLYSQNLQIKYLLLNHYYSIGNFNSSRKIIDHIMELKRNKKLPYGFMDISYCYNIYSNLVGPSRALDKIKTLSLGLPSNEIDSLVIFLAYRPELTVQDYKNFLTFVSLYRNEIKTAFERNPYVNLELGKKLWNSSEKAMAELYFSKALSTSDQKMKKFIQEEIYKLKYQKDQGENKLYNEGYQNPRKRVDTQKILEEVK